MSEEKHCKISVNLKGPQDWRKWFSEVESEANRLGLLQPLNNAIGGHALNLPVGAGPAQKWRNLWKAVKDSCRGPCSTFLDNLEPPATNRNAGELIAALRGEGNFNIQNLSEQRIADSGLNGIKFNDREQPADIATFLSNMRERMGKMNMVYSLDHDREAGDQLNHHLLAKSREWLDSSFHSTLDRLDELEEAPSFTHICNALQKRLCTMVQEGKYKIENASFGKAYPAVEEKQISKKKSKENEEEEGPSSGKVLLSKSQIKNMKKKAKKDALASVNYTNNDKGKGKGVKKGGQKGQSYGKPYKGSGKGWNNWHDGGWNSGYKGYKGYGKGKGKAHYSAPYYIPMAAVANNNNGNNNAQNTQNAMVPVPMNWSW